MEDYRNLWGKMEDQGKAVVEEKRASSIITYDSCIGHNCLQYNLHSQFEHDQAISPANYKIVEVICKTICDGKGKDFWQKPLKIHH